MESITKMVQEVHRAEKQKAQEQASRRKALSMTGKRIYSEIYAIFPELENLAATDPSAENAALTEAIDGIFAVLRFAAAHPKFANSIRTGILK